MTGEALVATDQASVLIAEDDRFDQLILKRAFKAAQLGVAVRFIEHGEELLNHLRRRTEANSPVDAVLPVIIFLDLNMPVVDGWEALRQLRAEPRWAAIPIVVMSTLTRQSEIERLYALGASAYFVKPSSFGDMVSAIRSCTTPWLRPPTINLREQPH